MCYDFKNNIRDGDSTALKAAYTVDTAYTVYTIKTVGVRKRAVTYGHYDNIWQRAFCRNN